jgi:hypothetical protein
MIIVSFRTDAIVTFAIEQAIIRHSPYGGVTRPKASDTMPIIAKCTGSMATAWASGCRIVPTMMIAGIASRKQPTTRNTAAMKKPVWYRPIPQLPTLARIAFGIW